MRIVAQIALLEGESLARYARFWIIIKIVEVVAGLGIKFCLIFSRERGRWLRAKRRPVAQGRPAAWASNGGGSDSKSSCG